MTSPVFLPDDPRLRSSSGLVRDLAVFYGRGGRDQEVVERVVLEPLALWREIVLRTGLVLLAHLVRQEPASSADAVADEIARRRAEKRRRS